MKIFKLLFVFIFLFTSIAFASDVTLIWDPNTETDLAGYRVYQSSQPQGYVKFSVDPATDSLVVDIPCGPNDPACSTYKQTDIVDGTYYWVVTAYDSEGFESDFSDEVTSTLNASPGAPQNLSIWELIISWFQDVFDNKKFKVKKG